jgi:hypothetical protein
MVENQWEGDKQMLSDAKTMERLERAEELARLVTIAQSERRPADQPGP